MEIPPENGGRGHNFYVWQLSEATVLMSRQIFRYGRKWGWINHQNQLSFIRSIKNWKRYECKCRSCCLVVWNVHMMLLHWKLWCFIKETLKFDNSLLMYVLTFDVRGRRLLGSVHYNMIRLYPLLRKTTQWSCPHTAQIRKFQIEPGGP